MDCPKITIITVTYNCVKSLQKTIDGVCAQTYPNIEYIIVDGDSTDGTLDIIKHNEKRLSYWESEQDKGIYFAMNKALDLAKGDYVNFMNAGDCFFSNKTLEDLFRDQNCKADIIYGDAAMIVNAGVFRLRGEPSVCETNCMNLACHQSVFVRTELMQHLKFDTYYTICADRNFFQESFRLGSSFQYFPVIIATCYAVGGYSYSRPYRSLFEITHIRHHKNKFLAGLCTILQSPNLFFRNLAKLIFSASHVKRLRRGVEWIELQP